MLICIRTCVGLEGEELRPGAVGRHDGLVELAEGGEGCEVALRDFVAARGEGAVHERWMDLEGVAVSFWLDARRGRTHV